MIAGVAVAGVVAGVVWRLAEVGAGGLESQCLDGVDDAESVADAGYAHLLQSVVVELEQNVASDVVLPEGVGVCAAFYVCKPSGDVRVGPGLEKVGHGSGQCAAPRGCTGSPVRSEYLGVAWLGEAMPYK